MKNTIIILAFLSFSLIGFGQVGQWDSTEVIIYPTNTTGKIVMAAGDTLYLIDVDTADAINQIAYINMQSDVKIVYDLNNDKLNDTMPAVIAWGNVNDSSKIYLRINGMTINSDSTMNLPKRITEIEVYSTPTDRNTYFNVPFNITATMTVVDATGGGDYTSIALGAASLGTYDTMIVKGGNYGVEDTPTRDYLRLETDGIKIFFLGLTKFTTSGVLYLVVANKNDIEVHNLYSVTSKNTAIWNPINTNSSLYNSYIHNTGTGSASWYQGTNAEIKNCYLESETDIPYDQATYAYTWNFEQNYVVNNSNQNSISIFQASDTAKYVNIKYNVFNLKNPISKLIISGGNVNFKFNRVIADSNNARLLNFLNTTTNRKTFISKGNIIKLNNAGASFYYQGFTADYYNNYCINDSIIIYGNGSSSITVINDDAATSGGNNSHYISDIYISGHYGNAINFRNLTANNSVSVIKSTFLSRYAADNGANYNLSFVELDTSINLLIEKNKIYNPLYFGSSPDGGHTCIYIADVPNHRITNNEVYGAGLASIVIKGDGVDHPNALVSGNKFEDIIIKGQRKEKLYNNTITNSDRYAVSIFANYDPGTTDHRVDSCEVYNNIIIADTIFYVYEADSLHSDYNFYYGYNQFAMEVATPRDYSWFTSTYGLNTNSFLTDPRFASSTQLWGSNPDLKKGLLIPGKNDSVLAIGATFPNPPLVANTGVIGAYDSNVEVAKDEKGNLYIRAKNNIYIKAYENPYIKSIDN